MARYPHDRFDDVPSGLERVGAHRAEPRRGRGWIGFAWAALATGLLVGAGVVYLGVANNSFQFTNPTSNNAAPATTDASSEPAQETTSAPPTQTATPVTDPAQVASSVTITVLNGTARPGLAATAATRLERTGWKIGTEGNASGKVATTTVYYSEAADEGVALGLAQELGVTDVQLSTAFPGASVTIVLGADYKE